MKKHQFLKMLCVFFGLCLCIEVATRLWWNPTNGKWFDLLEHRLRADFKVSHLFLGSSRVVAAIDDEVFGNTLRENGAPVLNAVNMSLIQSTLGYQFLWLQNLAMRFPGQFSDLVVFIEAPEGLPSTMRWTDDWYNSHSVIYSSTPINRDNYGKLLSAKESIDKKIGIFFNVAAKPAYFIKWRNRIRYGFYSRLKSIYPFKLSSIPVSESGDSASLVMDLSDPLSVNRFQESARKWAGPDIIDNWEESVVFSIIEFVESIDGRVVFFKMPVASVWREQYHHGGVDRCRELFEELRQLKKLPMLEYGIDYSDQDFPDLVHLDPARKTGFSVGLAENWMDYERKAGVD